MAPQWGEAKETIMAPTRPRNPEMPIATEAGDTAGAMPDLNTLPRRVDRRAAAELVSRFFFPVSYRSIEAWPLATRLVNGKAVMETAELLAVAKAKFDAAPAIRGGRR